MMLSGSDISSDLTAEELSILQQSTTELDRTVDALTIGQARTFDSKLEEEIRRLERVKLSVVNVRQTIQRRARNA